MSVTPTLLTSGNDSTGLDNTATTDSITPVSNRPVLVFVKIMGNPAQGTGCTVSGAGLTWTERATVQFDPGAYGGDYMRLFAFTGISASPSTGALTITATDSGNDTDDILWEVIDLVGASTTPFVQAVTGEGTGTAATATLATFGSATNCAIAFTCFGDSDFWTEEVGWTVLIEDHGLFAGECQSMYRANNGDLSPSVTYGTSAAWGMIALEIQDDVGGSGNILWAQSLM